VGNADNSAMDNVAGALGAAPIWHSVMAAGLASSADGWPAPPSNVHAGWANGQPGWFLEGTGPNTPAAAGLVPPGTAGGTQGGR
jgi:membrane carboxypeptidase/penicillin-binding protein PbpC